MVRNVRSGDTKLSAARWNGQGNRPARAGGCRQPLGISIDFSPCRTHAENTTNPAAIVKQGQTLSAVPRFEYKVGNFTLDGIKPLVERFDREERLGRAYLYWAPRRDATVAAEPRRSLAAGRRGFRADRAPAASAPGAARLPWAGRARRRGRAADAQHDRVVALVEGVVTPDWFTQFDVDAEHAVARLAPNSALDERIQDAGGHDLGAVVAGVDRSFYENPGINPLGLVRALWNNLDRQ